MLVPEVCAEEEVISSPSRRQKIHASSKVAVAHKKAQLLGVKTAKGLLVARLPFEDNKPKVKSPRIDRTHIDILVSKYHTCADLRTLLNDAHFKLTNRHVLQLYRSVKNPGIPKSDRQTSAAFSSLVRRLLKMRGPEFGAPNVTLLTKVREIALKRRKYLKTGFRNLNTSFLDSLFGLDAPTPSAPLVRRGPSSTQTQAVIMANLPQGLLLRKSDGCFIMAKRKNCPQNSPGTAETPDSIDLAIDSVISKTTKSPAKSKRKSESTMTISGSGLEESLNKALIQMKQLRKDAREAWVTVDRVDYKTPTNQMKSEEQRNELKDEKMRFSRVVARRANKVKEERQSLTALRLESKELQKEVDILKNGLMKDQIYKERCERELNHTKVTDKPIPCYEFVQFPSGNNRRRVRRPGLLNCVHQLYEMGVPPSQITNTIQLVCQNMIGRKLDEPPSRGAIEGIVRARPQTQEENITVYNEIHPQNQVADSSESLLHNYEIMHEEEVITQNLEEPEVVIDIDQVSEPGVQEQEMFFQPPRKYGRLVPVPQKMSHRKTDAKRNFLFVPPVKGVDYRRPPPPELINQSPGHWRLKK